MQRVYLYGVFRKTTKQFPVVKMGPGRYQTLTKSDKPTPIRLVDLPNVMEAVNSNNHNVGVIKVVSWVIKPATIVSPNIDRQVYDRRGKVLEESA